MAPLRRWLGDLATDHHARAELVRRTLVGTVHELAGRTERIAGAVDAEQRAIDQLDAAAAEAFDRATWDVAVDVRDGTVMRGEVLARWQELLGTGEFLRQLQSTIGRLRDRITNAVTRRPPSDERFQGAVSSGVEQLVVEHAARAVDEVNARWRNDPAGVRSARRPGRAHPGVARSGRAGRSDGARLAGVAWWTCSDARARGRQFTARFFSYGVNAAALVLMVAVFSQTGGLTGAEIAIAGGSSAVGQRLLEALLGEQAVRALTIDARTDLERRVAELMTAERERFTSALEQRRPARDGDRLRTLAAELRAGVER